MTMEEQNNKEKHVFTIYLEVWLVKVTIVIIYICQKVFHLHRHHQREHLHHRKIWHNKYFV